LWCRGVGGGGVEAVVFLVVELEVAGLVTLSPAVLHFLVPLGVGDGALIVLLLLALALEAFDLGLFFFLGPGRFGVAGVGRVRGGFLLEVFEFAEEAEVGIAEVALVAGVEEEGVGGGIGVEGFGEGEAGRIVGSLAELVELGFGFVGSLQTPEDGGELVEELFLEGVGGVEGFAELFEEDVVGGGTFVGEERGLGAEAVLEGVLGGVFFAARGFGAGGFGGVAAVGSEFSGGETVFGRAEGAADGFGFDSGFCGRALFD
jgi:hypothetical protein